MFATGATGVVAATLAATIVPERCQRFGEQSPAVHVVPCSPAGHAMCDKCTELDRKIEHLQDLATRMLDQMTTDGIAKLIQKLLDQKAKLHSEEEQ